MKVGHQRVLGTWNETAVQQQLKNVGSYDKQVPLNQVNGLIAQKTQGNKPEQVEALFAQAESQSVNGKLSLQQLESTQTAYQLDRPEGGSAQIKANQQLTELFIEWFNHGAPQPQQHVLSQQEMRNAANVPLDLNKIRLAVDADPKQPISGDGAAAALKDLKLLERGPLTLNTVRGYVAVETAKDQAAVAAMNGLPWSPNPEHPDVDSERSLLLGRSVFHGMNADNAQALALFLAHQIRNGRLGELVAQVKPGAAEMLGNAFAP